MALIVYSTSSAFRNHIKLNLEGEIIFKSALEMPSSFKDQIYLLHISSQNQVCVEWLRQHANNSRLSIAICSDLPDIEEMLECVELGAKAYCNSYMQGSLYEQLLRLLSNGQSWFPPKMLEQTFKLAKNAVQGKDVDKLLSELTPREKEVALLVADGLSNKNIADKTKISERTVKTHLTNIFIKLQIKDRVALVLYLK